MQQFAERRPPAVRRGRVAGFGALGGDGAVDFSALAAMAVISRPPGRPGEVVEAIGRGIGRVAAHELAHQILSAATSTPAAIPPATIRRRQPADAFYGPIHWDLAGPWLRDALGVREPPAGAR